MKKSVRHSMLIGTVMACSGASGRAIAQSVGYQKQLTRLEGQTQVIESAEFRSGGRYLHCAAETPGLGAAAANPPYERHSQFVISALGGVFLKTIAEQAGGGPDPAAQDKRLISALTGATEDIITVDAGPAMAGRQGLVTIPLRIWFRADPPDISVGAEGVYWSYAVNYAAVTGDPDSGAVHWEEKQAYSMVNYLLLGSELLLPEGPDFNEAPVLLQLPVTFGTPELFTVAGGVSATVPLSQPRGPGIAGTVARLEISARFLPGLPTRVGTAEGTELPPGTWTVKFASGHHYGGLPEMPPPRLILPADGKPGGLEFNAAPGLDYRMESGHGLDSWTASGPVLTGNGTTRQLQWQQDAAATRFFRLKYSVTP